FETRRSGPRTEPFRTYDPRVNGPEVFLTWLTLGAVSAIGASAGSSPAPQQWAAPAANAARRGPAQSRKGSNRGRAAFARRLGNRHPSADTTDWPALGVNCYFFFNSTDRIALHAPS